MIMRILAIALALVAMSAQAQEEPMRFYGGVGVGAAEVQDLCRGVPAQYCEDTGVVVRGAVGWEVNRNFILEAAFNFAGGFVSPGARAVGYDGDTDVSTFGINAIGVLPLGDRVSLLGGLSGAFGLATTEIAEYQYQDCDLYYDSWYDDWEYYCRNNRYEDEYESDASLALGALVGVDLKLSSRFHVRAQAQRFFNLDGELSFLGERDVDFLTASFLVYF